MSAHRERERGQCQQHVLELAADLHRGASERPGGLQYSASRCSTVAQLRQSYRGTALTRHLSFAKGGESPDPAPLHLARMY